MHLRCVPLALSALVAACSGDVVAPTGGARADAMNGGGDDDGGGDHADAAPILDPGCVQGTFTGFHGDLHDHTSHSFDFDGGASGDPAAAFRIGRQNGLDYLAVTDHLRTLTAAQHENCKASASAANQPGTFAAICGYEETTGETPAAHGMFLFASAIRPDQVGRDGLLAQEASCDECVGQFNHPANGTFPWRDLGYDAAAGPHMHLFELNGAGFDGALARYVDALDAGWHVGPSWNSDTHLQNWGEGLNRTVVYASELSREALKAAMRAHRTAGASDRNAGIVLAANGCWMGSELTGWTSADLSVDATDANSDEGFTRIILIGPGGASFGDFDCGGQQNCSFQQELAVLAPVWVVAVAAQLDGSHVVSAPIWFAP
jgi:hypothetical protein